MTYLKIKSKFIGLLFYFLCSFSAESQNLIPAQNNKHANVQTEENANTEKSASIEKSTKVEKSTKIEKKSATENFQQANQLLNKSNQFEQKARNLILTANKSRKEIAILRAKSRKEKQATAKAALLSKAEELTSLLEKQQKEGAGLRADSLSFRSQSMHFFEQGLVKRWKKWIHSQTPLTMDEKTISFLGHNAQVRSVHPTMLNKMGGLARTNGDQDQKAANQTMTLQVAALVSQKAPPNLDISAFQLSSEQHYLAHIEMNHTDKSGLHNPAEIPLNEMHQWLLIVTDKEGSPISEANIDILGHMPGHVHGLPTQPMVTDEIEKGVYLVEGLKFQMQGWWVIKFNIKSKNAFDTLTFNLVL